MADSLAIRIKNNTELYQRLVQDLTQEHAISLAYEDISTQLATATEKLKTLQVELDFLTKSSKKEYDNLHKARHFSVRSAAATLKGKKKALIAKEEAEYQRAFEIEQEARRQVEVISSELTLLSGQEKQLKDKKDYLKSVRHQLEGLLDEVFAEPEGTELVESQLGAELQNYIDQYSLATRDLQRFRDTDHNLVQASRTLAKTKELIQATLNYVPFDLFGGGGMVDEQQVVYVQACQRNIWECQRRLNVVRSILPEIPYPASLDVITNNHMLGLRFDGGYVDIAWKGKTQQGYNVLVNVEKNIQTAMQWTRHYLHYTEGAIDRLFIAKETAKTALYNERRRIIDRVVSSSSSSLASPPFSTHNQSNSSTSSANNSNDIPPPVYEPPAPPTQNVPNPMIPENNHSTPFLGSPAHSHQQPTPPVSSSSSSATVNIPFNKNNPFRQ